MQQTKGDLQMMTSDKWERTNQSASPRIVVTAELPGNGWLKLLHDHGFQVDIYTGSDVINKDSLKRALKQSTAGIIGQLTESWGRELFEQFAQVDGMVYSNYAVGFDNVDLEAAFDTGIVVCNTPGVLTETTAELAVALTFSAARKIVQADEFMRRGSFEGWRPNLYLGELLYGKTLGLIGAGRIGSAYARMMTRGYEMDLLYYNRSKNEALEKEINEFGVFLEKQGRNKIQCNRADSIDELLAASDVVSLHVSLNEESKHLIGESQLRTMKPNAVLVNTSRGSVIDETALVAHCSDNPEFKAGLDVFEDEPEMKPGLAELPNVVLAPHIGSATSWTRENMSRLAALNIIGALKGYPVWKEGDMSPFLTDPPPEAVPSVVNPEVLDSQA